MWPAWSTTATASSWAGAAFPMRRPTPAGSHDLGIHSEMLCNSMVDLVEEGVITGRKKTYLPGMIVGTFLPPETSDSMTC